MTEPLSIPNDELAYDQQQTEPIICTRCGKDVTANPIHTCDHKLEQADRLEEEECRWREAFQDGAEYVRELAQEALDNRAEIKRLRGDLKMADELHVNNFTEIERLRADRLSKEGMDVSTLLGFEAGQADGLTRATEITRDAHKTPNEGKGIVGSGDWLRGYHYAQNVIRAAIEAERDKETPT